MNTKMRVPDFNSVTLIGRLTKEPDLRYTQKGGQAVCTFSIAINRNYRDSSGNWQKEPTFVPVRVWREAADRCGKRLKKGSPVLIQGRLKTLKWEDKEGNKKSMLEVEAQRVTFMETESEVPSEDNQTAGFEDAAEQGGVSEEEIPF